jgi:hypothetical protein
MDNSRLVYSTGLGKICTSCQITFIIPVAAIQKEHIGIFLLFILNKAGNLRKVCRILVKVRGVIEGDCYCKRLLLFCQKLKII